MKPSVYISRSVQVSFIMMIAVRTITGKSQGAGPDYGCNGDYFDCAGNDYVYNNEDGNDYTYNNKHGFDLTGGQHYDTGKAGEDYIQTYDNSYGGEGEPLEYTCYSCTFHVRKGNAAGLDNCRDPFVKLGIPEVPCQGACAKIYHKTSETEYTVTRICLPNCKEVKDDKGYTQCCWGNLCNGSNSYYHNRGQYLTLILGLLCSLVIAIR